MSVRIKIAPGKYLTPLNSAELLQESDGFAKKCVMCRDVLTKETMSVEHIYPKWLQERYNLWNQTMTLPNGSKTSYKNYTVPCCKECNGGAMSEWEREIQQATSQGFEAFSQIEKEKIVWWVMKLYYAKLLREMGFKEDIKNPNSPMMRTDECMANYNGIFYYMNELIKGTHFCDPKPYELYIYKTGPGHTFDYMDDIARHVTYIQLDDILIICALDSFGFFKLQYSREIEQLKRQETVSELQALELFAKIIYFKSHYGFDTEHSTVIDGNGVSVHSEIKNPRQIREFDIKELHELMTNVIKRRDPSFQAPSYKPGMMFTFI